MHTQQKDTISNTVNGRGVFLPCRRPDVGTLDGDDSSLGLEERLREGKGSEGKTRNHVRGVLACALRAAADDNEDTQNHSRHSYVKRCPPPSLRG